MTEEDGLSRGELLSAHRIVEATLDKPCDNCGHQEYLDRRPFGGRKLEPCDECGETKFAIFTGHADCVECGHNQYGL